MAGPAAAATASNRGRCRSIRRCSMPQWPESTDHRSRTPRGTQDHAAISATASVATPEQVVVTHGAAHAVDLLARVLLRPGEVAAVEELAGPAGEPSRSPR